MITEEALWASGLRVTNRLLQRKQGVGREKLDQMASLPLGLENAGPSNQFDSESDIREVICKLPKRKTHMSKKIKNKIKGR